MRTPLPLLALLLAAPVAASAEAGLAAAYAQVQQAAPNARTPCAAVASIEFESQGYGPYDSYFLMPTGGSKFVHRPVNDPLPLRCEYSPADFAALAQEVNDAAFFALRVQYSPGQPASRGLVTTTTIRCADGTEKTVRSYRGAGPEALKDVEARIAAFAAAHACR